MHVAKWSPVMNDIPDGLIIKNLSRRLDDADILIIEQEATIDEVRKYAAVMFNGAHRDIAKKLIRIVKLKDLPEDEKEEYV